MSLEITMADGRVVVIADEEQMREARAVGRADVLRLLEYDAKTMRYFVSELALAKAGLPIPRKEQ